MELAVTAGSPSPETIIEQQAVRCVQCALCLPHCPTFRATNSESESPRGRIALARALANGGLSGPAAWRHLDHCLDCQACSRMCPSKVDYARLRQAIYQLDTRPLPGLWRMVSLLPGGRARARAYAARLAWLASKLAGRK